MKQDEYLTLRANDYLLEHQQVLTSVYHSCIPILVSMAQTVAEAFQRGNKLFLFGNGGSAADAQHIAAEFVNRFRRDRKPLPAIALTTDSSVMTSIANDFEFADVFRRQLSALGKAGDVVLGLTTSGNSQNVRRVIPYAKGNGFKTMIWTGGNGALRQGFAAQMLEIPSTVTSHIQEAHIVCGHILCDLVDEIMFGETDG